MTWVKSANSELWACSQCAWAFKPSGPPLGNSLDEMMQNFERQRDQEFASHVCTEHPRTEGRTSLWRVATRLPLQQEFLQWR